MGLSRCGFMGLLSTNRGGQWLSLRIFRTAPAGHERSPPCRRAPQVLSVRTAAAGYCKHGNL